MVLNGNAADVLEGTQAAKRAHTNLGDLQIAIGMKNWTFTVKVVEGSTIVVLFANEELAKVFELTGTSLLTIFKRATDAITVLEA